MGQASVLIVEDDAHISGIVAEHLGRAGYACTQAFSGTEARLVLDGARQRGERFDVVVCDLMLPGLSGEDIVRLIRAADADTPIVVTSARSAASDKVDLLKLGADDYLAKPFDLDELLARIEVQLRHRGRAFAVAGGDDVLRVGKWTLDRAARTLSADGVEIPLTRTEFNIVELLAAHPKKVYTKQELFELAWGEPFAADDSTVSVHVSNIRAKLKPTGTDGYIQTVWGLGFKLAADAAGVAMRGAPAASGALLGSLAASASDAPFDPSAATASGVPCASVRAHAYASTVLVASVAIRASAPPIAPSAAARASAPLVAPSAAARASASPATPITAARASASPAAPSAAARASVRAVGPRSSNFLKPRFSLPENPTRILDAVKEIDTRKERS